MQTLAGAAEALYQHWEVPGKPMAIYLSRAVTGAILLEGRRGLMPRRRPEVGGILLGTTTVTETVTIRIEACLGLPCEHLFGPAFTLSESEKETLRRALVKYGPGGGSEICAVGFYRTHTRRGLGLDSEDLQLAEFFPEGADFALLVKPHLVRRSRGAFFFWDDAQTPAIEFPVPRHSSQDYSMAREAVVLPEPEPAEPTMAELVAGTAPREPAIAEPVAGTAFREPTPAEPIARRVSRETPMAELAGGTAPFQAATGEPVSRRVSRETPMAELAGGTAPFQAATAEPVGRRAPRETAIAELVGGTAPFPPWTAEPIGRPARREAAMVELAAATGSREPAIAERVGARARREAAISAPVADPAPREPAIAGPDVAVTAAPRRKPLWCSWWVQGPLWVCLAFLLGHSVGYSAAHQVDKVMPRAAPPPRDPYALSLLVLQDGDNLHLSWDRQARPITIAERGSLLISDAGDSRTVDLTWQQLRHGAVAYHRLSDRVQFRLEVYLAGRRSVSETWESPAPGR